MNISGAHKVMVAEYPNTTAELIVPVQGLLLAVGLFVEFGSVYSTSLDIDIHEEGDNMPDQGILAVTGVTGDGWYYPVAPISDQSGGAVASQYDIGIPLFGNVNISLANAQPGDTVYVTFKLG